MTTNLSGRKKCVKHSSKSNTILTSMVWGSSSTSNSRCSRLDNASRRSGLLSKESEHTLETIDTTVDYYLYGSEEEEEEEEEEEDGSMSGVVCSSTIKATSSLVATYDEDETDVSMSFEELLAGGPYDDSVKEATTTTTTTTTAAAAAAAAAATPTTTTLTKKEDLNSNHQSTTPKLSNRKSVYNLYLSNSRRSLQHCSKNETRQLREDKRNINDQSDSDNDDSSFASYSFNRNDDLWDLIKDEWRGSKSNIQVRSKPPTYRPYIELNIDQMILDVGEHKSQDVMGPHCDSANNNTQSRTLVQRQRTHLLDQRLHSSDPTLRTTGGTSRRRRTAQRHHRNNTTTRQLLMQSHRQQYSSPNLNYSSHCEKIKCDMNEKEDNTNTNHDSDPILNGVVGERQRRSLRRPPSHNNMRTMPRPRSVPINLDQLSRTDFL